jgi:hypothetical protein
MTTTKKKKNNYIRNDGKSNPSLILPRLFESYMIKILFQNMLHIIINNVKD